MPWKRMLVYITGSGDNIRNLHAIRAVWILDKVHAATT